MGNDWDVNKKLIEYRLDRICDKVDEIIAKQNSIEKDIVALKVKAGLWGLIGASIPITLNLILSILLKQ